MANPRHHTLLGVLLPLLLALAPSLAAGTSILPVSDGPALVAALGLSELPDIILLTGNISLSRSLWPLLAPITISSDVILQGASGGTYVSLDFNYAGAHLVIAPNVTLTFRHLAVVNWTRTWGQGLEVLCHSPGGTLLLQDVIGVLPAQVPSSLLLSGTIGAARPAAAPPVAGNSSQQQLATVEDFCFENTADETQCFSDVFHAIDLAWVLPAFAKDLCNGGSYLQLQQNVSEAALSIIPTACIVQNGPEACFNQAVDEYINPQAPPPPPLPPPLPPSPPAALPPPADSSDDGSSDHGLSIIVPASVVGGLLLIGALLFGLYRLSAWRNGTLMLKFLAPGAGPGTTLAVTDIEGSTPLWESLPTGVMDTALQLHHLCIREVLAKHCGAESATEGDSFIVAFHDCGSACRFALEVQEQLLQIEWPEELVASRSAQTVWATPPPTPPPARLARNISVRTLSGRPPPEGSVKGASISMWPVAAPSFKFDGTSDAGKAPVKVSAIKHWFKAGDRADPVARQPSKASDVSVRNPYQQRSCDSNARLPQLSLPTKHNSSYGHSLAQELAQLWRQELKATVTIEQELLELEKSSSDGPLSPQVVELPTSNQQLVFRGLRVRIGLNSGLEDCHITRNRISNRTMYSGRPLAHAKATSDMAVGGMTVLSSDAFRQLVSEPHYDPKACSLIHMGSFVVGKDDNVPDAVYQAIAPAMFGRLAFFAPLRAGRPQLFPGAMDAPCGLVSIAFMHMVGHATLRDWNAELTAEADRMFAGVVQQQLMEHQGYMVELSEGFCLTAFKCPTDAISFGLAVKDKMSQAAWRPELLEHELCEEISFNTDQGQHTELDAILPISTRTSPYDHLVVSRGPRIKVGIDCSSGEELRAEISSATGRMVYRGRMMNRAARIAAKANSGKVLCTVDAWTLCQESTLNIIQGSSMGVMQLKGVGSLEVISCRWVHYDVQEIVTNGHLQMPDSRRSCLFTGHLSPTPFNDPLAGQHPQRSVSTDGALRTLSQSPSLNRRMLSPGASKRGLMPAVIESAHLPFDAEPLHHSGPAATPAPTPGQGLCEGEVVRLQRQLVGSFGALQGALAAHLRALEQADVREQEEGQQDGRESDVGRTDVEHPQQQLQGRQQQQEAALLRQRRGTALLPGAETLAAMQQVVAEVQALLQLQAQHGKAE